MLRLQQKFERADHRWRRLSRTNLESLRHPEEHRHPRRTSRSSDRCEDQRAIRTMLHLQQGWGRSLRADPFSSTVRLPHRCSRRGI